MQVPVSMRCRPRAGIAAVSFSLLAACGGGAGESPPTTEQLSRQFASHAAPAAALAPLTVTGSVPGDGGNNAARTLQPAFTFSALLNAASLNADNFKLRAASAGDLPTPASIQVIDRVARLQPEARLLPQTQYTVRAEPGIQDQTGQTLAEPVQRSFTTADASWKNLLPMPGPSVITGARPAVAIDGKGNAWAAWSSEVVGNDKLYVNHFDAARGTWSEPLWLGGGRLCEIGEPQLAVDGPGNAVLVWRMRCGSGGSGFHKIMTTRYSALTGTWGDTHVVSHDEGSSNQHHNAMPRLAVRAGGEVAVAWRRAGSGTAGGIGVYVAASSAQGGGWTWPIRIDDPATTIDDGVTSLAVALAPEPGRRMAVAWVSDRPGGKALWASVFQSHVAWPLVLPTRVSDTGADPALDAGVSIDGAGDAYAIWRRQGPAIPGDAYNSLWYARHDGNAWQAQRLIGGANDQAFGAHIAGNTNLGQPATWVTWFDQGRRVMATPLRAAGPDAPRLIGTSPDPLNANQASRHVVDAAGNVLVAWTTGLGVDARVMAARYVARLGTWQAVRQLDQRTLQAPYTVALAIGDAGDAVTAWQGLERDVWGVPVRSPLFVRRFD